VSVSLNDKLWQFALDAINVEGVAAECLAVQDRYGVDVCILLAAAFAAVEGHPLTVGEVGRWNEAVAGWRETVVRPLRKVRQELKEQAAVDPSVVELRRAILAAELQAERRELEMLAEQIALLPDTPAPATLDREQRISDAISAALTIFSQDTITMPRLLDASCRRRT
jgi:uncharacterized protein (TIGR02444 family)